MTLKRFILISAISMATLPCISCNREASKSPGTPGAGPSADQRASIASLKRSLDEIDARIQAMGAAAGKTGSKVKQATKDDIAKLEAARDRLYGQLQELQTASAETWEDLKARTAASVDSLGSVSAKVWRNVAGEDRSASTEGGE